MRRIPAVVALAMALGGCTGTRLVQRDGCWIRQTTKIFRHTEEELGPCARTTSPWSDDRLTRLMQECVSREDWRWQTRAVAAWNRGEPWPAQLSEQNVLSACMTDSTRAMMAENDALKKKLDGMNERVAEVSKDRDALRARSEEEQKQMLRRVDEERKQMVQRVDEERKRMLDSHDKFAAYLGEAAKKSSQPATATATATSEGRARTESTGSDTKPMAVVSPPTVVTAPPPTVITAPPPTVITAPPATVVAAPATTAGAKGGTRPKTAKKAEAPKPPPECPPTTAAGPAPVAGPTTAAAPPAEQDDEAKALASELNKAGKMGTGSGAATPEPQASPAETPAPPPSPALVTPTPPASPAVTPAPQASPPGSKVPTVSAAP